jgi:hypothetical protein
MENVKQEIVRLHDFFVVWMTGAVQQTDEEFMRFADSMGDNFYIVAPSGLLTRREALVKGLYQTYNQRQIFRIWIENVQVQHVLGDVIVATYEEWQSFDDEDNTTARLSTVVFSVDESKPNGLLWQCVHETWLTE